MKLEQSTFTIVTNGFADGPAQPLRDHLVEKGARRVVMISHPLVAEGDDHHVVTCYENGALIGERSRRLPNKPPYTFAFDPFFPARLDPSDVWFGFNNLAALRGLRRRRRGATQKVCYWAVDFVPNRFGARNPLTAVYNRVDRRASLASDLRVELSEAASEGRSESLGLDKEKMAPVTIAPMGTWLGRTPKAGAEAFDRRKVVFLGHLVERQGVETLLRALAIVIEKDRSVTGDIIGGGPLLEDLRALAKTLGISDRVRFHGFVADYADVERLLGQATVAAAAYVREEDNFSKYADPGKLKAYLGASLPIVLTEVPPNARELRDAGAARLSDDEPLAFATELLALLGDRGAWHAANESAARLALEFDWSEIFARTLSALEVS